MAAARKKRGSACSLSFFLFAAFYCIKYFTFKPAPFHELMYQNLQDLATGSAEKAAWITDRERAKTSIAKIGLVWLIAQKQVSDALRHNGEDLSAWGNRLYIDVASYDKANAESVLFDVVTELQANEHLIADVGHLYYQPRRNV
jgi:hypothetical protein